MERQFRLIMTATDIPLESNVTKRNGSKVFVLRKKISIYDQDSNRKDIYAENGCFFLCGSDGNISAIDGNTVLIWHCEIHQLQNYIDVALCGA